MHDAGKRRSEIMAFVPPTSHQPALVDRIASDAVARSGIEMPLAGLLSNETGDTGLTADDISIVGNEGANRDQAIQFRSQRTRTNGC